MTKPDYEYVVLSQSDVKHLVCVRRNATPDWLQVIASFVDIDRAEQYADCENDMAADDEWRSDVAAETPTLEAPPDQLRRLVHGTITQPEPQALPRKTSQLIAGDDPETEPDEQSTQSAAVEPDHVTAGSIPEVIIRCLDGFMEKYPGGPTIKNIVAETRLAEGEIRAAFNEIRRRGLAVVYQAKSNEPLRVAPLGFEPQPAPELSRNQEVVLDYLTNLPPDGGTVSPPSVKEMHKQTGVPQGSLGATIADLERKGKIEIVKRGDQFNPPRYRVVERTILRQAIARGDPSDVSHLVFDDPPHERSALAAKQRREAEAAE